jgi:hypothetical protein
MNFEEEEFGKLGFVLEELQEIVKYFTQNSPPICLISCTDEVFLLPSSFVCFEPRPAYWLR